MKFLVPVLGLLIACGGGDGDEGEPIDGSVVITVGSDAITPSVGAAVVDGDDPNNMVVMIGTAGLSCSTAFDATPKETAFVATVPKTAGTHDTTGVLWRSTGNSRNISASDATVVIDGVGARVTGSIEFDTTNSDDVALAVTGTFDVISCL
jgi:hypothetical protein